MSIVSDSAQMKTWLSQKPDTVSVANFVPGPGVEKLALKFDIKKLRTALDVALQKTDFKGMIEDGFGAFSLTRRPGVTVETPNDLSGLFYTRVDDTYEEVARVRRAVDERAFSEFVPAFRGTYFEEAYQELNKRFTIGRDAGAFQAHIQLQFVAPRSGAAIAYSDYFQSRFFVYRQSSCYPFSGGWFGVFHRYVRLPHCFERR